MYAVIVFALVLLSPMPFVSPFGHIVQDVAAQSPFGPFEPATSICLDKARYFLAYDVADTKFQHNTKMLLVNPQNISLLMDFLHMPNP